MAPGLFQSCAVSAQAAGAGWLRVDVDQADGRPLVCQQGPGGQNPSSELVRDKGESPLLVVHIGEDRVGACRLWRQFHLLVRDGRVADAIGPALSEPGHRLADQTAVMAGFTIMSRYLLCQAASWAPRIISPANGPCAILLALNRRVVFAPLLSSHPA